MAEAEKEISVYPPVIEYLKTKHQSLKNNYLTEDNKYAESCGLLACDIARAFFLENGERPSLLSVRGELLPDGVNKYPLIPKIYGGRISWGGHVVSANGDTVFDPMVGKPMSKEKYAREVFDSPVVLEETVPSEFIEEFLKEGKS